MTLDLKKIFRKKDWSGDAAIESPDGNSLQTNDFPFLTSSVIQPEDDALSMSGAVLYYKAFMRNINFFRNDAELLSHANIFQRKMKAEEKTLKYLHTKDKKELNEAYNELNKLVKERNKLEKIWVPDHIDTKINRFRHSIRKIEKSKKENKERLDALVKCKRQFLIDYVNSEVHGRDWLEKYYVKFYKDLL